ncbi:MAG: prenyltransferase/squalene oxidase repeat-containing protein [Planctomycetaceae bacterium]
MPRSFLRLAEQAAGNPAAASLSVQQLEREAATGAPAGPIGVQQRFVSTQGIGSNVGTIAGPHFASHAVAASVVSASSAVTTSAADGGRSGEPNEKPPFYSPPARFEIAAALVDAPSQTHETANVPNGSKVVPASLNDRAGDGSQSVALKKSIPKKRRARISLRKIIERARLVTLEQAERVRVRARKSDLKPKLRTTTEEVKQELKRSRRPAAISSALTALVLFLLTLARLEIVEEVTLPPLVAGFSEKIEPVEESLPIEPPAEEVGKQLEQPIEEPPEEMVEEPEPEPEPEPAPEPPSEPMPMPEPMPATETEMAEAELPSTPDGTVATGPNVAEGATSSAVDHRSEAGRKLMVEKYGGSAASESAVGFALAWLTTRQRANGTWDFIDVGPCRNPGTVNNPIGGTAYALLPFLAAGQTHKDGQYRKSVLAGLEFLTSIGVTAPAGYDLRGVLNKADDDEDPNYAYYVHGAATLALCEAYGMTKDRKLKPYAEGAVKFLVNSQDPRGGGWRYNPQQSGSTSATTIQVMALKAAEKAGIKVPDGTWKGVTYYLDSVALDGEGRYGYEIEKKSYGISVTSMALLSRMYLGKTREDNDLRAGVALIDKRGPYDNLYYNYFATQVMKNWGGAEWDRWNGRLRDDLIAWQGVEGDDKGSWAPRDRDDYSKAGGRLLTTCLATLTLEVYYRYRPLLPEQSEAGSAESILNVAPVQKMDELGSDGRATDMDETK